jgi:hypothetical protein
MKIHGKEPKKLGEKFTAVSLSALQISSKGKSSRI